MKMRAMNHLNLVVSDVERSAAFYQTLFGMERQYQEGEFIFLACGETDVALVRGKPLIHRRFHFGFRVDSREEVDQWIEAVRKHEAPITHGPEDYGDYYTFSCRDPDGYALEIYFEQGQRGRAGDVTKKEGA
jgi:catechol 2,3-dioxygenase-like lactoylglutathione lyase family enzyme